MNINPCGSCHNCCRGTLVRVKASDVKRWKKEGRYDIVLCVERWVDNSAFLIHKPNSLECIFLKSDVGCEIHNTRPDVCKRFPYSDKQKKKYDCLL
ncbi:YkgJ family cysteine cluster protein [Candidatus Woesearchaeota archaeon]|nr:YkgJ family cysteine cluster protein [Candidatus Woesearchaeota archaeon]MCF8013584.1 YkgJ family cysteine cluster protein [Candidatus Woesearchaeota archaeon]